MKILAIDTSCSVATVALMETSQVLAEFTINNNKTHSEHLITIIDVMFKTLNLELNCIDYIACSIGPGSFTGLRIGVATAKGIGHALNKKIIPVPTLQGIAYNVYNTTKTIVPIMDCRRENVYTSMFKWENNIPIFTKFCDVVNIDDLLQNCSTSKDDFIFCGDAVISLREKLDLYGVTIAIPSLILPKASSIASLAFNYIDKAINYAELEPYYFRATQAEREYTDKG